MEKKEIEKNHIRVRFNSRVGNIIRYVNALIKEDNPKTIFFSAIGGAIGILVNAVEVIKIVNPGFYQLNKISSVAHKTVDNTDKTEVIERLSPKMDITLSLENFSDTKDEGYQEKLDEEARLKLFNKLNEKSQNRGSDNRGPRRGGRGRGGQGFQKRDNRDFRDNRDNRDNRDFRDNRNNRDNKDLRDNRDNRDNRNFRDNREGFRRGGPRGAPRGGPRGGFRGVQRDGPRDFYGDNQRRGVPRGGQRGGNRDFQQRDRGFEENRGFDGGFRNYNNNRDEVRSGPRGGLRGGFRGGPQRGGFNERPRPMTIRGRGGNFSGNRRGSINRY